MAMGSAVNGFNTIALLGLVVIVSFVKYIYNGLNNPLNKVPGPWYARWTNLRLKAATLSGKRIHYVHALHLQYGPYVRISPYEIAVNDVAGFKQIHSFSKPWNKSPWYRIMTQQPRAVAFTFEESKPHMARRRMFARAFSKSHIREHWESSVVSKVQLAAKEIAREASENGGVVDVMKWWTFMASDVAAHLMFGESFGTLEAGVKSHFIEVLEKALMGNGIGAELPLVRWIGKKLPLKATQDVFSPHALLMDYAQAAVTAMRSSTQDKNVFATIMAEAEKGEHLDELDVKYEAVGLIIAGTDTTAITLTYLSWVIASRPMLQVALAREAESLPKNYNDADIEKKMPLLNATIEECLRLYGAAPGMTPRMVPAEGATMNGYFIPGGTTAITQSYSLHRDPELFPDPYEFKPERWLAETTNKYKITDEARAVYSPWGAGTRSCIGLYVAQMELRHGAVAFLRECKNAKVAPSTTAECMEFENYFLIRPAGHKCELTM